MGCRSLDALIIHNEIIVPRVQLESIRLGLALDEVGDSDLSRKKRPYVAFCSAKYKATTSKGQAPRRSTTCLDNSGEIFDQRGVGRTKLIRRHTDTILDLQHCMALIGSKSTRSHRNSRKVRKIINRRGRMMWVENDRRYLKPVGVCSYC